MLATSYALVTKGKRSAADMPHKLVAPNKWIFATTATAVTISVLNADSSRVERMSLKTSLL
jgi:hypothetical protein